MKHTYILALVLSACTGQVIQGEPSATLSYEPSQGSSQEAPVKPYLVSTLSEAFEPYLAAAIEAQNEAVGYEAFILLAPDTRYGKPMHVYIEPSYNLPGNDTAHTFLHSDEMYYSVLVKPTGVTTYLLQSELDRILFEPCTLAQN